MRAAFKPLLALPPRRARPGLEILEDRAVASMSVLGAPVPDPPAPADFGLPSLTSVPVTADAHLPPSLGQVFGDQPTASLQVPFPEFLSPAGTATVTTPSTGAVTVTSFEVDNDRLNQQAGNVQLPNATRVWFSSPGRPSNDENPPALDVVHLEFAPLRLELLGIRVEVSRAELTASFEHPPGSPPLGGPQEAAVLADIVRVLNLFDSAFDTAVRAVGRALREVRLPPPLSLAFGSLTPPAEGTIHVAGSWFGPIDIQEPGLSLSVPRARADVYADTGPDKPLGNGLAAAARMRDSAGGFGALMAQLLKGMMTFTPISPLGLELLFIDVASLVAIGSDSNPGVGHAAPDAIIVRPPASDPIPFFGGGPGVSLKVGETISHSKQEVSDSEDGDPPLEDDDPLPPVLPDISLPEESRPPVSQPDPEAEGPDGESQLSLGDEQREIELGLQMLQVTVALTGGQFEQLWWRLCAPANGDDGPVGQWEPICQNIPAAPADRCSQGPVWLGIAWSVIRPFLGLIAAPLLFHHSIRPRRDESGPLGWLSVSAPLFLQMPGSPQNSI